MVCARCKMVVQTELIKFGLHPLAVELAEVTIAENGAPVCPAGIPELTFSGNLAIINKGMARRIR